jgi:hypothetical protein
MPCRNGGLEGSECLLIGRKILMRMRLQRIEAALTSAFEECHPHLLVLERKMSGVKFQKSIVITNKTINGKKIFGGMRNMKNVF